jgi:glycosyltransferase involved in cell wall biosynthesis
MHRRIGYIISQYPAINHTFMLREVRQLRETGWDVQTYSIRPPDRPAEKLSPVEQDEATRTRYVKTAPLSEILAAQARQFLRAPGRYLGVLFYAMRAGHPTLGGAARRALYFAEAVILGRWLEQAGLRHLHSHYSPMVALLVSRLYPGITFSMTVHGPDEFNDPQGSWLAGKIGGSRFSIAISSFARSQMMLHSPPSVWRKIHACYMGVPEMAEPAAKTAPGRVHFLCVGRVAPVKGQRILVESARLLKERGLDFQITIAGGGPDLAELRQFVADRQLTDVVSLPGFVSDEDLARLYRETDVFVLPSFAEGVPGVLMEAMGHGLPCISSCVNGVPELVLDGQTGILVPASDAGALADAMARLLASSDLRRQLGAAGHRQVTTKFSLPRNVARLAEIIERELEFEKA